MHSPKGPALKGESWVPLEEYPIYIYIYKGTYQHVPPIYGLYNGNFPFNSWKPENDFNMIFQLRNRGNPKTDPPQSSQYFRAPSLSGGFLYKESPPVWSKKG